MHAGLQSHEMEVTKVIFAKMMHACDTGDQVDCL
jgi:hypothetical protein